MTRDTQHEQESDDDDDDWLDDVEVSKDEIDAEDESLSEVDVPIASLGAGEGDAVADASGGKSGSGGEGSVGGKKDAGGEKAAGGGGGGHGGVMSSSGGKKAGGKSSSSSFSSSKSSGKPALVRVPNTPLQKKITGKLGDGKRELYFKHASGRELAASFMNSTGTILQETSQQIQEINNAMRYLQDNLW